MFAEPADAAHQDFAKALEDVIRTSPPPEVEKAPVLTMPSPPASPVRSADRQTTPTKLQDDASKTDAAFTATLRDTAELLDAKANLLERTGAYADADRLRRLAQRMRREARRWTIRK